MPPCGPVSESSRWEINKTPWEMGVFLWGVPPAHKGNQQDTSYCWSFFLTKLEANKCRRFNWCRPIGEGPPLQVPTWWQKTCGNMHVESSLNGTHTMNIGFLFVSLKQNPSTPARKPPSPRSSSLSNRGGSVTLGPNAPFCGPHVRLHCDPRNII